MTYEKDRVGIDQFLLSFASSFSSKTIPNASESSSVQEEEMIATITEEIENDEQVVPEFIDHPIPEFSDLNIDVSVTPIGSTPDRRDYLYNLSIYKVFSEILLFVPKLSF